MPTTAPMGSIRGRIRAVLTGALILSSLPLYGQTGSQNGNNSLLTELRNIDQALGNAGLSLAERREILVGRARLLSLAGDIEGAGMAWLDAAFADAENWDDRSILEGVRCFIAQGELGKAETHIKTVLLTGKDPQFLLEARYLSAYIEAFRSENTRPLAALLDYPQYADKKPAMLYVLWHISHAETYKNRLLEEFPASPEARILKGDRAAIRPSAFWLLPAGRDGVYLANPVPASPPAAPSGGTGSVPLQTGLFGREENAQAMAARLRNAGFTGTVSSKRVNGAPYWVVTVPGGTNMEETIRRLKSAGFEAFPVF